MSNNNPKVEFASPNSSKKGVYLHMANFKIGNQHPPFEGGKFIVEPLKKSNLDQHKVQECWMVAKREGILFHENNKIKINEGDFLFYESFKTHQVSNTSKSENLIIYTVWW